MRMDPIRSPLARGVYGDHIVEGSASGDSAVSNMVEIDEWTANDDAHHWERPTAPSIQEVELKNMP